MTFDASKGFLGCCRKLAIVSSEKGIMLVGVWHDTLGCLEGSFSSGTRLKLTDFGVPCADAFVIIFAFLAGFKDSSFEVEDLLAVLPDHEELDFEDPGREIVGVLMGAGSAMDFASDAESELESEESEDNLSLVPGWAISISNSLSSRGMALRPEDLRVLVEEEASKEVSVSKFKSEPLISIASLDIFFGLAVFHFLMQRSLQNLL